MTIRYLTQAQVDKRAKYLIAASGSCFAPTMRLNGTITTLPDGRHKFNCRQFSALLREKDFWYLLQEMAKKQNAYIEVYADKNI